MCGIVGYIGNRNGVQLGLSGLKRLAYRGYDSAGIVFLDSATGLMRSIKRVGNVDQLIAAVPPEASGNLMISHTRWATHGGVTEANAHPHGDCEGNVWVIHNGIIENYKELKAQLESQGHIFRSETDTEVVVHLIEELQKDMESKQVVIPGVIQETIPLHEVIRMALGKIRGAYGLLVVDAREPDTIIAARHFSPLILGMSGGEAFVASDAAAFLPYTNNVVYLNDGDIAVVKAGQHMIYGMDGLPRERVQDVIEWTNEEAEKGGYAHFMLKEMMEEPDALRNALRGRMLPSEGRVMLGGLVAVEEQLRTMQRLIITGCGTSYYAGSIGKHLIEHFAPIPVEVQVASELKYANPVFRPGDIMLALSQSGETVDTLGALRVAREHGITTLGIVNVVGSTIARDTDAGVYEHIGPEIGVASTKAFLAQVGLLTLFALHFAALRGVMSQSEARTILEELERIPGKIERILAQREKIKDVAVRYATHKNFLYLGRTYNAPVAYEGTLKLKEIAYVHAEGIAAGEMKHGPLAMIDEQFPSVVIAPKDTLYEKMASTVQEIKARSGPVIAVATEGDLLLPGIADDVLFIPETLPELTPLLAVIPLQLFAYESALIRGCAIDAPRNLAKSVTVE